MGHPSGLRFHFSTVCAPNRLQHIIPEWRIQYMNLRREKVGLLSSKIEKVLQGIWTGLFKKRLKVKTLATTL